MAGNESHLVFISLDHITSFNGGALSDAPRMPRVRPRRDSRMIYKAKQDDIDKGLIQRRVRTSSGRGPSGFPNAFRWEQSVRVLVE